MDEHTEPKAKEEEVTTRQSNLIRNVEMEADVVAAYYRQLIKKYVPAEVAHYLVLQRFPAS